MKTIVTHIGPDLDAIASIWLIRKFFPGWEEATYAFVPAGKTYKDTEPDSNPDIIHVDTGFGKYDHHQADDDVCAAQLVYTEVAKMKGTDEPLERMLAVVNDVDHFREVFFPNPTADFWGLSLVSQIDGWRLLYTDNPIQIVELGIEALEGIYKLFQNKVWAEKEIHDNGVPFETRWGKGMALFTVNDEVVHLAQKMGYAVVVRKDSKKGYVRIKSLPKSEIDLTALYEALKSHDPQATWFLHASRHMILNGSSKNPDMKPSTKSLEEIITVITKTCS